MIKLWFASARHNFEIQIQCANIAYNIFFIEFYFLIATMVISKGQWLYCPLDMKGLSHFSVHFTYTLSYPKGNISVLNINIFV